jgi:hypothetical protein
MMPSGVPEAALAGGGANFGRGIAAGEGLAAMQAQAEIPTMKHASARRPAYRI